MDAIAIEAEIERLGPWLHDVEVRDGVRTGRARGSDDPDKAVLGHYDPGAMIGRIVDSVYGGDLGGRSFLDCGCNAGGHAFAAARRGAGRSLAFDARDHWLDQAAFLARFHDAPLLELKRMTLDDLRSAGIEPFDVTLFSGLFYHLPDPVAGLKVAADLTRELLIVNTSVLPRRHRGLVLSRESATVALSGVDRLAWLPTGPEVMTDILEFCGYPHVRIDMYWTPGIPRGWKRLQILAARDEKVFARYDKERPDAHPSCHVGRIEQLTRLARGAIRRLRG